MLESSTSPSTPARAPRRGRRLTASLVAVLAVATVLAGCGHSDPTSYGDTVQRNFVQGCQVTLAGGTDNANDSAVSAAISSDPDAATHRRTCECVYTAISDKDSGIPFGGFKALQDAVRDRKPLPAIASESVTSGNELPKYAKKLRAAFNSCASSTTPTTAIAGGGGVLQS